VTDGGHCSAKRRRTGVSARCWEVLRFDKETKLLSPDSLTPLSASSS
jgi:hypothetical protein